MIPEDRWPVRNPPSDFADRVMERIEREERKPRLLRWVVAAAAAAVLAGGGAAAWATREPTVADGELVATERTEIDVAPGVTAVVEREGHIAWTKKGVTQDRGDVFYRAAPGKKLRIETPRGEVASSEGTCSRVRVDAQPGDAPTVYVQVAQGDVKFQSVSLGAGRYARVDQRGMKTDREDVDGSIALALAPSRGRSAAATEAPLPAPPPQPGEPPTAPIAVRVVPSGRASARASASAPPSAGPPASARPPIVPACVCSPLAAICDCQQ